MPKTYQYKLAKWAWGIFIDIACEVVFSQKPSPDAIMIEGQFFIEIEHTNVLLTDFEREMLIDGAKLMASKVSISPTLVCTIRVLTIQIVPTDYQAEGLKYALAGWIATEFGLPLPEADIRFDKKANRYLFP
jgi:hypothetical protein